MSEYRIFETEQFQKDLRELGRHPHFGAHVRKLQGYTPDTGRYRIGAWRFFYEIDDEEKVVSLTAAAHRGSAY